MGNSGTNARLLVAGRSTTQPQTHPQHVNEQRQRKHVNQRGGPSTTPQPPQCDQHAPRMRHCSQKSVCEQHVRAHGDMMRQRHLRSKPVGTMVRAPAIHQNHVATSPRPWPWQWQCSRSNGASPQREDSEQRGSAACIPVACVLLAL
jgi:hypothetical protein